jgi:cell division protein FtsB
MIQQDMASTEGETIYERVAKLEDEIASLRNEVDVLKKALRNKLARHEISQIKRGKDVTSIID